MLGAKEFTKLLRANWHLAILSMLVIVTLMAYLSWLFKTNLVYGIDGPYYLLQIKSILKSGSMKYPDPPLFFYLSALASYLVGDIILGFKLTLALMLALAGIPLALTIELITKSRIAMFVSYIAFSYSAYTFRLAGDLVKNTCGLLFVFLCIFFIVKCLFKPNYRGSILAAISLCLVGLTHILDFLIALAISVLAPMIAFLLEKAKFKSHELKLKPFAPIYIVLILVVILGSLTPIMGGDMGKVLSFIKSLGSTPPMQHLPPWGLISITFLIIGVFITMDSIIRKSESKSLICMSMVMVIMSLIFNAYPLIPHNFMWRISLMNVIPVSYFSGCVIGKLKDQRTLVLAAVALLILAPIVLNGISMANVIRPTITSAEAQEIIHVGETLPAGGCLLVPKVPLRYWTEYLLDSPVFSKISEAISSGYRPIILLIEKGERHPPAKPFFLGSWIEAYFLTVRS